MQRNYHEIEADIDAIVERDPQGASDAMAKLREELEATKNPYEVDAFTRAYMECALWSSSPLTDDLPPDESISIELLAPETLGAMIADCATFQLENSAALKNAYATGADRMGGAYDASNAGHDFWLTRCGHGAGFWDRGLGEHGEVLSNAARAKGNLDLYIGDDGKIYA